jgi:TM2 domain-containing membrane protein YozV
MAIISCPHCGTSVSSEALVCPKCNNKISGAPPQQSTYQPSSYQPSYQSSYPSSQKVDMFLMSNSKYFESHQLNMIRERLSTLDDSKLSMLTTIQYKDPTTSLIVSLLAGGLGIDRFMIGDSGLGVGKLLTCGGFGIWTIVDWFQIQKATREKNLQKLQQYIY